MSAFISYALYPWGGYLFLQPPEISVGVRCFSLVIFLLSICIVMSYSGTCPLIERIFAIQIFYSTMGLNAKTTAMTNPSSVHVWADRIAGSALALILTLALFCFEGVEVLVQWFFVGTLKQGYVLFLSPLVFSLLAVNWWFVALRTRTPMIEEP